MELDKQVLYKTKVLGSHPGAHMSFTYFVVAKDKPEAIKKVTKEMTEVHHLCYVEVVSIALYSEEIII